jgi:WD40 repeat protein
MKISNLNFGFIIVLILGQLFVNTELQIKTQAQTNDFLCLGNCDLDWSPNDNVLAAVNQFGLWIYDLNVDTLPTLFPFQNATSLDFSSDGELIAITACNPDSVVHEDCNISIFDTKAKSWQELPSFDFSIKQVRFSPDGQFIAVIQEKVQEWGLRIIDLSSGENITIIDNTFSRAINTYEFSPESNYIAISNGTLSMQNNISIWDVNTLQIIAVKSQEELIEDINYSSNTSISYVESNSQVLVWDFLEDSNVSSYLMTETPNDNLHEYNLVDHPRYLLGSLVDDWNPRDRTLYVWSLETGQEIFAIDMPADQWPDLLEVSQSGEYFMASDSGDDNKIIDIWNIETREYWQLVLSE